MIITLNLKFRSQVKFIYYLCLVFLISSFCFFPLTGCDTGKKQDKLETKQEEFGHLSLDQKWKGDFDGMVERRLIRVLVVFNRMGFSEI